MYLKRCCYRTFILQINKINKQTTIKWNISAFRDESNSKWYCVFQELYQANVWIMSGSAFCLQGSGILMQMQILNFSPTILLEIIQQKQRVGRMNLLLICLDAVAVIKMTIIWIFACMSYCCLTRGNQCLTAEHSEQILLFICCSLHFSRHAWES